MISFFSNVQSGHFTDRTGRNHSGVVYVDDNGVAYSDPKGLNVLMPNRTTIADMISNRINRDRIINDSLSLPYSYDDVKFTPNTESSTRSWKDKLQKLHTNNLFISSRMYIPSVDTMYMNSGAITLVEDTINGGLISVDYSTIDDTSPSMDGVIVNGSEINFTSVKSVYTVKVAATNSIDNTIFFGTTDTHIFAVKVSRSNTYTISDPIQTKLLLYSDKLSSGIKIGNINDSSFNGKTLYVVSDANLLISINIDTFIGRISFSDIKAHNVIGGRGDRLNSISSFNKITSNEYMVIVYDSLSQKYKRYTPHLEYVGDIGVDNDIEIDNLFIDSNNVIYITSTSNTINLYDVSTNTITPINIDIQNIKKIAWSVEDSNIVYILGDNKIHKRFLTKIDKDISSFNVPTGTIRDFSIDTSNIGDESDDMVIVSDVAIILSKGDTSFVMNTFLDTIPAFLSIDIGNYDNQFQSTISHNVELAKIFNNILNIRLCIKGRFAAAYVDESNIEYIGIHQLEGRIIDQIKRDSFDEIMLNSTETLSSPVLNRSIKMLYDMQETLLSATQIKITNSRVYDNDYNAPIITL